jgi:uncharacterized protein (TIGR02145 family)
MAIINPHIHDWYPFSTVTIGSQIWSARNIDCKLNYTVNCWWPEHLEDNVNDYGVLYNWDGVLIILAKYSGWHLPTEDEVDILLTSLGGASVAGGHLKASGTNYWLAPNTGADNSSGFTALGAGTGGTNFKTTTRFWMEEYDSTWGEYFRLNYDSSDVLTSYIPKQSEWLFSIRLIKDLPPSGGGGGGGGGEP